MVVAGGDFQSLEDMVLLVPKNLDVCESRIVIPYGSINFISSQYMP